MCLRLFILVCLTAVQLCTADEPVHQEIVTPKKMSVLGSWSNTNPNSTDVQNATHHAVEIFNKKSKGKKIFKLVSIESAQIKVTNQINYRMKVILARTNCLKVDNDRRDSCNLEERRLKCTFIVASHPKKDKPYVHRISCNKM